MGLTIHYSLKTAGQEDHARKLVHALHEAAQDLPFKELGEVVEFRGDECNFNLRDQDDPHRWLLIQADGTVVGKKRHQPSPRGHPGIKSYTQPHYSVIPEHIIAFRTWPGEGCEAANFGLCKFPATLQTRDGLVKTRMATGWRWHSFCKTQYASDPACGGVPNFLRCHLSVVALLDAAKKLGCLEAVSDESHFWLKRSIAELVKEIGSWNEFIAAFGGLLKDMAGAQGMSLEAQIANYPDFERLEAAGQGALPEALKALAALMERKP